MYTYVNHKFVNCLRKRNTTLIMHVPFQDKNVPLNPHDK